MKSFWSAHIKDKKEQQEFKEYVLNSTAVIDRLRDWVEDKKRKHGNSSDHDYDSPSWAYKQADALGYLRCLRQLEELLTFDQKEK